MRYNLVIWPVILLISNSCENWSDLSRWKLLINSFQPFLLSIFLSDSGFVWVDQRRSLVLYFLIFYLLFEFQSIDRCKTSCWLLWQWHRKRTHLPQILGLIFCRFQYKSSLVICCFQLTFNVTPKCLPSSYLACDFGNVQQLHAYKSIFFYFWLFISAIFFLFCFRLVLFSHNTVRVSLNWEKYRFNVNVLASTSLFIPNCMFFYHPH